MSLTKDEFKRVAAHAAAAKHGEKHAAWYNFRHLYAGPSLVVGSGVAVGVGAWWIWTHVREALHGGGHAVPAPYLFFVGVLVVLTAVAWRPRRLPLMPVPALARGVLTAVGWLMAAGFGLFLLV